MKEQLDHQKTPDQPAVGEDGIPAPSGATSLIDTDYVVGQDNFSGQLVIKLDIHSKVFLISAGTILLFVLLTLALQEQASAAFTAVRGWLTSSMSGFLIMAANVFVLLCLVLIVTPLGKVRLGGKEAKPDYTYMGWFSMLFAAGMGIGLMFYGVAEPMSHFTAAQGGVVLENGVRTDWAPLGGAAGDNQGALSLGMAATIYHWGLHPWAIYAIVALALALFSFNKGLPLSIRSIFYPLLGERVWGWPGHLVDVLAVFATMFGLVTSLGVGAQQASAGMELLFGIPSTDMSMVLLIIAITAVALWSVVAGVDKGVQQLSKLNMLLAFLLLAFVIAFGPTLAIFKGFVANLGAYVTHLPALSNPVGREDANFVEGWTAFYWAWWISWSPFVGMFIARISRPYGARVSDCGAAGAFGGVGVVDDGVRRHGDQPGAGRPVHRRSGRSARATAFRYAEPVADGVDHLIFGRGAGDTVFYHLIGFGLTGDRHHHCRRKDQRAGIAASLLGGAGRRAGDCAASWRRAGGLAGHGGLHRAAVHGGVAGGLRGHRQRLAQRATLSNAAPGPENPGVAQPLYPRAYIHSDPTGCCPEKCVAICACSNSAVASASVRAW